MYYTPSMQHRLQGIESLHREIWKDNFGPIPEGHEIHHKDGNPLNNAPSNLECISCQTHHERHKGKYTPEEIAALRLRFEKARAAACNWHGSDAGRQWHKELGRLTWLGKEPQMFTCEHCGQQYESLARHGHNRFCSNACRAAERRKTGRDNETRQCAICDKSFSTSRFQKAKCCSPPCSQRHRFLNH